MFHTGSLVPVSRSRLENGTMRLTKCAIFPVTMYSSVWWVIGDSLTNGRIIHHRTSILQASGEVGDCAAKNLIEKFGRDTKNPAYTDHIIRSTLGSLYVGKYNPHVAWWLLGTQN